MKNMVRTFLLALALTPLAGHASWVSEITGIDVDLNRGSVQVKPPNPAAIPQMIQNLPKDVSQVLLNPAAPVLATAIRSSRGQALNRGTQPIPGPVQQSLSRYFPSAILQKVRWTTAGGLSIDAALKNWLNQEGAVTLDDVVVFSDAALAQDVALWAHELTHVLQYAQLGVETFAFSYLYRWNDFEGQARQNSAQIMASINATRAGQQATWSISGQPGPASNQIPWGTMNQAGQVAYGGGGGFPPGYGMQVCGCNGPTAQMVAAEPRCQSGAVRINVCPGICPAGGQPYAYVCQ